MAAGSAIDAAWNGIRWSGLWQLSRAGQLTVPASRTSWHTGRIGIRRIREQTSIATRSTGGDAVQGWIDVAKLVSGGGGFKSAYKDLANQIGTALLTVQLWPHWNISCWFFLLFESPITSTVELPRDRSVRTPHRLTLSAERQSVSKQVIKCTTVSKHFIKCTVLQYQFAQCPSQVEYRVISMQSSLNSH